MDWFSGSLVSKSLSGRLLYGMLGIILQRLFVGIVISILQSQVQLFLVRLIYVVEHQKLRSTSDREPCIADTLLAVRGLIALGRRLSGFGIKVLLRFKN